MRRLGFVVVICCLLIAPVIAAQLKVDVALVNVVATITDETGHYVSDLTQDDLVMYEDGQPQKISHFSQANDLPVSLAANGDLAAVHLDAGDPAAVAIECRDAPHGLGQFLDCEEAPTANDGVWPVATKRPSVPSGRKE